MPTNTLDATLTDTITSITLKHIVPNVADNVNRSNVALMKVKKKTVSGGTVIQQPVRYQRGIQENYSGGQTLNTSYVDKNFAFIFNWKQKNFPIVLNGLDEIKNSGPEAIVDHVENETKAAVEDAMDSFATGLYSAGTDSLEMDGAGIWLSTSNTYGGISQSSNSWAQAKIDSTTNSLSLARMQERYEAAKEGNDAPTLITFEESQFNVFWGLLQPQQRFSDGDTAKAGFRNLMFNGAICAEDSYCPTGYVIFWNMDRICLYSHSSRNFPGKFIPFEMPYDQDVRVAHYHLS